MPMTLTEYQRGQIYAVAEAAKRETGGGDGIEVLANEPFENVVFPNFPFQTHNGHYTFKKYHINNKVPGYIRLLTPCLDLKEESWNAFPYSRTVITNDYLGDRLNVTIDSIHIADRGGTENALNLTPEQLAAREIVIINIGEELEPDIEASMSEDEIPRRFRSKKTSRGPLGLNWIEESEPIMCCYKVVICEFRLFGLQTRLEQFIQRNEERVFSTFHRRMFCWIDKWIDMTLDEVRQYDDNTSQELNHIRENGAPRGLRAIE